MTIVERGRITGGHIELDEPLDLPEGTEVEVRIQTTQAATSHAPEPALDLTSLPFFGLWVDRDEMADSAAWVNQQREQTQRYGLKWD